MTELFIFTNFWIFVNLIEFIKHNQRGSIPYYNELYNYNPTHYTTPMRQDNLTKPIIELYSF